METFDVAVVGAGITGLATARALARQGREVILLEQFDVMHTRGSSHGNSRIFRLSYAEERWVRLAQASLPLWRELEEESGVELLEHTGSLDLGNVDAHAEALTAAGARFELLTSDEVMSRFPLTVPARVAALHQPDGGFVHADRARAAFLDSARAHGAEVRKGVRVDDVAERDGGVLLETSAGEVRARAAVVTAGAWAPRLVELAVTTTRETVAYFDLDLEGPLPSLIDWATPAAGGRAGYALAAPGLGLKAGLHRSGPRTNPDHAGSVDFRNLEWTRAWVAARFPSARSQPFRTETCLYTNTEDESFVLERRGRVVVGSACSGHGFKFAPELGRILAGLAVEA